MPSLIQNRGAILNLTLSGVAIAILVSVGLMTTTTTTSPEAQAAEDTGPLRPYEVRAFLHQKGLSAESLGAAGVDATAAQSLVTSFRTELADHIVELRSLDATIREQSTQLRDAEDAIRKGIASEQDVQACNTLRAQRDANVSQHQTILDSIYTASAANIGEQQRVLLARINDNREKWKLPTRYLTLDLEDAQWIKLRDALTAAKNQQRYGLEPDETLMAHKLDCDAQTTVIQAKQRIENAINQASSPEI